MKKLVVYLVMLLGEVLVALSSMYLLQDVEPTNLLAFNVCVISMVYLLLFASVFNIFNVINNSEEGSNGKVAILWLGLLIYFGLSILGIYLSYLLSCSIFEAVLMQGGAIFVLLIFVILYKYAHWNFISSDSKNKESLKMVSALLWQLEVDVTTDPAKSSRIEQVNDLKDKLRYITYSSRPAAVELDNKVAQVITELKIIDASETERWNQLFNLCLSFVKLRKQQL